MTYRHNWKEERLKLAKELGFESIDEAIIQTYRKTKSSTETGKILGGITSDGILRFLKWAGEPIQNRGGWHGS